MLKMFFRYFILFLSVSNGSIIANDLEKEHASCITVSFREFLQSSSGKLDWIFSQSKVLIKSFEKKYKKKSKIILSSDLLKNPSVSLGLISMNAMTILIISLNKFKNAKKHPTQDKDGLSQLDKELNSLLEDLDHHQIEKNDEAQEAEIIKEFNDKFSMFKAIDSTSNFDDLKKTIENKLGKTVMVSEEEYTNLKNNFLPEELKDEALKKEAKKQIFFEKLLRISIDYDYSHEWFVQEHERLKDNFNESEKELIEKFINIFRICHCEKTIDEITTKIQKLESKEFDFSLIFQESSSSKLEDFRQIIKNSAILKLRSKNIFLNDKFDNFLKKLCTAPIQEPNKSPDQVAKEEFLKIKNQKSKKFIVFKYLSLTVIIGTIFLVRLRNPTFCSF